MIVSTATFAGEKVLSDETSFAKHFHIFFFDLYLGTFKSTDANDEDDDDDDDDDDDGDGDDDEAGNGLEIAIEHLSKESVLCQRAIEILKN